MKTQYIPVETVTVGDLVSVTWKERDITKTVRGRVDKIIHRFGWRVFVSYTGIEFVEFHLERAKEVQCILHDRKSEPPIELFTPDWIEKVKEKVS